MTDKEYALDWTLGRRCLCESCVDIFLRRNKLIVSALNDVFSKITHLYDEKPAVKFRNRDFRDFVMFHRPNMNQSITRDKNQYRFLVVQVNHTDFDFEPEIRFYSQFDVFRISIHLRM